MIQRSTPSVTIICGPSLAAPAPVSVMNTRKFVAAMAVFGFAVVALLLGIGISADLSENTEGNPYVTPAHLMGSESHAWYEL